MICIWSSWCHCHPIISCCSKIQNGFAFWCRLTQVVLEKKPLNGYSSSNSSRNVGNGPMNKWLNFGGDPDHPLATGIVFRIRHYWDMRKVASSDCAAWCCSAGHVLAGITIATITLLRHRLLAEECTVPVLLVHIFCAFIAIFYALFVCGLLTFVLIFSDYTLAAKFGHNFLFSFT